MTTISTETMPSDPWGVVPQRLRPPRARDGVLTRTALLDRLLATDAALVVVRAGAGYGKTTLLAQWAEREPRPAGWLSLDMADNDPVVLLRHLVRALADCGVDTDPVEHLLQSREPQVDRDVLPALAVALEQAAVPFLLVLDDVHLVDHRDAIAALDDLIGLIPRRLDAGAGRPCAAAVAPCPPEPGRRPRAARPGRPGLHPVRGAGRRAAAGPAAARGRRRSWSAAPRAGRPGSTWGSWRSPSTLTRRWSSAGCWRRTNGSRSTCTKRCWVGCRRTCARSSCRPPCWTACPPRSATR